MITAPSNLTRDLRETLVAIHAHADTRGKTRFVPKERRGASTKLAVQLRYPPNLLLEAVQG